MTITTRRTRRVKGFTGRRQPGPHGVTLDMLAVKHPEPVYVKQFLTEEVKFKGAVVRLLKVGDWSPYTNPARDAKRAARRAGR